MNDSLTHKALSVINRYRNLVFKQAASAVPYFNNRTTQVRSFRANVGKGSPEDILEEVQTILIKNNLNLETLNSNSLRDILIANNIGIDCSGFAYHVLEAESLERGKGPLRKKLRFVNCPGFLGRIRASLRPVENCSVATLATESNSRVIPLIEVKPGDLVTMIGDKEEKERDHVLVIHQVERLGSGMIRISYSHASAYPEDGLYKTGIKQGVIEIVDPKKPITEARWIENGKEASENRLRLRAQKSKTELRRLRWF